MKRFFMLSLLTGVVCAFTFWVIPEKSDAASTQLSHFSRANCINNESVSWDGAAPHWLWVNSWHKFQLTGNWHCENDLGNGCTSNYWEYANHNGGIHWGEAPVNYSFATWYVEGHHWWINSRGYMSFKFTSASSCNLNQY